MKKTTLDYWNPKNEIVATETGFRYLDTNSVITRTEEVTYNDNTELFIKFYKLNNELRYCNGIHYTFQDKKLEKAYHEWLKSDEYKSMSFQLYYGNGVVD